MQRRWRCTMGRSHLFVWFLLAICLGYVSSADSCSAEERQALLDFIKPFDQESLHFCGYSWNSSLNCCQWKGIECSQTSRHVRSIDLSCLRGPLLSNSSVFRLRFLQILRLYGDLQKSSLPDNISKLGHLRELTSGLANLSGSIPISVCKLRNLRILSLHGNSLTGTLPSCLFDHPNLPEITLWSNRLEGSLPKSITNQTRLERLRLWSNMINGAVPTWVFTLPSLRSVDLDSNNLTGSIKSFEPPATTVLHSITLGNNRITGSLPSSLFQLVNVTTLSFSNNFLSGDIEWHWLKAMRNLDILQFARNRGLSFRNSNGSTLQFPMLSVVNISSTSTTEFPTSLSAIDSLINLDVSNNNISGRIFPRRSGGWKSLMYFYASHNLIAGFDEIPESILLFDLSFNKLQGPVLPLPKDMQYLFLSNNLLSGEIPARFCNATNLLISDLSFNNLSGVIPSCMMNTTSLAAMNLQGNHFHGTIPDVSVTCNLLYLILSDNKFEGTLTRNLRECISLQILDVGNNNITDIFPGWLDNLVSLQVLILRSNNFHGDIGVSTVENPFRSLQILDLSLNSFDGSIPLGFIANLGFIKNLTTDGRVGLHIGEYYENAGNSPWRVKVILQYSKFNKEFILPSFTIIDLSSNHLSGPIPATFGQLNALKVLNLSNNALSGAIPSSLANIGVLESLDLSENMLVGKIPQGLMDLSFLEFLNVSYNKLEGPIPTGKRSELLSNSSYIGNPGLCGLPLSKVC